MNRIKNKSSVKNDLLKSLREGKSLSFRQQLLLIIKLSIPAIMAQLSSILMEYIDASMVGSLGANGSAAIGLVASSTWLLAGLCSAVSTGFTVLVAQSIGAKDEPQARKIVKIGLIFAICFSIILLSGGTAISTVLPKWLGGSKDICPDASKYLIVYALSLPAVQMTNISGGMIQASGNMKLPSMLHIVMCFLDIIYNMFLIFPAREVSFGIFEFTMPGAGLGVMGAAIGTALAQLTVACIMLIYLLIKSPVLKLRKGERFTFDGNILGKAVRIAIPVGIEQIVMCGAQIVSTRIVSPLGNVAIAANSLSVTAESLCYMPCYGIGAAATTLIGQSVGAGRRDITKRLGWITTGFGMVVMAVGGGLMYILAPVMIGVLSPDPQIRELGTLILRIEAFAEPMYAASIVASGVFHGAGDAAVPSIFSFVSMWAVRLPLAALLAGSMGLQGVWIAMAIELCVRGILFIVRLSGRKWLHTLSTEKES